MALASLIPSPAPGAEKGSGGANGALGVCAKIDNRRSRASGLRDTNAAGSTSFVQLMLHLIVLTGLTGQLGYNGSRVAVSLYALDLGANQFTVGILVALYAVFPMLLAIVIGQLVDRVGPALPSLSGVIAMGVALILPPLFPGIATLYVSCSMLGIGHLLFIIPIEATIGGIGGPERRAANYALLSMGWSIANSCGPVIAGLSIDHVGHVQVFWVLAATSLLPTAVLAWNRRLLPRHGKPKKDARTSAFELWRKPNLRMIFITGGIINSAQSLFQFYFPIYGHSLGISASAIGAILGSVAAAAFAVRSMLPVVLKKWSEAQLLVGALFLGCFAYLVLPFVHNPYMLGFIACMLGLGVGCSNPLLMSLLYLLTPQERMAESVGLLRTAYNLTQWMVPLAFGSVGTAFGFPAVFLSNAAMLAAGGMLLRRHPPGPR